MHRKFAAAAERHALYCRDGRRHGILEHLCGLLKLRNHRFDLRPLAHHQRRRHGHQIRADGKGRLVPNNQAAVILLGFFDGALQTIEDIFADGMHF